MGVYVNGGSLPKSQRNQHIQSCVTILITTRNPECKIHATAGWCELVQMETEEAVTLMLKTTGVGNLSDESARETANATQPTYSAVILRVTRDVYS
jgi:hypothetical protein